MADTSGVPVSKPNPLYSNSKVVKSGVAGLQQHEHGRLAGTRVVGSAFLKSATIHISSSDQSKRSQGVIPEASAWQNQFPAADRFLMEEPAPRLADFDCAWRDRHNFAYNTPVKERIPIHGGEQAAVPAPDSYNHAHGMQRRVETCIAANRSTHPTGEDTGGGGDASGSGAGIEQTDFLELRVTPDNLKRRLLPGQKATRFDGVKGSGGVQDDKSLQETLSLPTASLPESLEASATPWLQTTSGEVDEGSRGLDSVEGLRNGVGTDDDVAPTSGHVHRSSAQPGAQVVHNVAAASCGRGIGGGGVGGVGEGGMTWDGGSSGHGGGIGGSSSNAGGVEQADLGRGRSGGGQHPYGGMGMRQDDMSGGARGHVTLDLKKREGDALHLGKVDFDGTQITKDELCRRVRDMIQGVQEGGRLRFWRKGDASRREYADGEPIPSGTAVMVEVVEEEEGIDYVLAARQPGMSEMALEHGPLMLARGFDVNQPGNRAFLQNRDDKFLKNAQRIFLLRDAPKEAKEAYLDNIMRQEQPARLEDILKENDAHFDSVRTWMPSCFKQCMAVQPKPGLETVLSLMISAFSRNMLEREVGRLPPDEAEAKGKITAKIEKANGKWASICAKQVGESCDEKFIDSDEEENLIHEMMTKRRERLGKACPGASRAERGSGGKGVSREEENNAAGAGVAADEGAREAAADADEGLKQAKALLDEGILTQEEFEREQKALRNEREVAVQRAQTESQRAAALAHTHATQGAVVEVGGGESASQDCLQGYAAAIAEHATTPENGEVAAGKEKKRRRLGKEELVFFRLLEEKERHVCAHCSKIFGTLQGLSLHKVRYCKMVGRGMPPQGRSGDARAHPDGDDRQESRKLGRGRPLKGNPTQRKRVLQLDVKTREIVGRFDSLTQAAASVGGASGSLSKAVIKDKVFCNYRWQYASEHAHSPASGRGAAGHKDDRTIGNVNNSQKTATEDAAAAVPPYRAAVEGNSRDSSDDEGPRQMRPRKKALPVGTPVEILFQDGAVSRWHRGRVTEYTPWSKYDYEVTCDKDDYRFFTNIPDPDVRLVTDGQLAHPVGPGSSS